MMIPTDVHSTDAVKTLLCLGFTPERETRFHHIMRGEDGRIVVVPIQSQIAPGAWTGLLRRANLTLVDFLAEL